MWNGLVRGVALVEANTLKIFKVYILLNYTPRQHISNRIYKEILLIVEPEPKQN